MVCLVCGRSLPVNPAARDYEPDRARTELIRLCLAAGCPCEVELDPGLDIAPRTGAHNGGKHVRSRRGR